MDVDCIFASVMIKRRGCWVALSLQPKKLCNKIQESKLYLKTIKEFKGREEALVDIY